MPVGLAAAVFRNSAVFWKAVMWAGALGGKCLVAFRRATSDWFSRAVLWDIVMAGDLQGRGLG